MKKSITRIMAGVSCIIIMLGMTLVAGCSSTTASQGNINENTNENTNENIKDSDSTGGETTEDNNTLIRIASLKGPTSIGMVKLMDEENAQYEFTIYATADEIASLLVSGKVDIANIPANLASVLYTKTKGQIKVLNINTLGVLYLVGRESDTGSDTGTDTDSDTGSDTDSDSGSDIACFEDAKGKTIYMTGAGTTPEYAFSYLLAQYGLSMEDYHVEFKSEATEVVSALVNDPQALGILPQPYVTVAETQVEGLHRILDFTEEWNKVSTDSSLITGVTVVRTDFLNENEAAVRTFMSKLQESIGYVNENVDEMAASVEKYDIIKEAIAKKAIPYCNLCYVDGPEMKKQLSGYLKTLYDQNQASVGGAMPGDDFYYQIE